MPSINTTQLENLANLDFETFKALHQQGQNRADVYYTALRLEAENVGLGNVVNYANLARDVVNNSSVNGQIANNYTNTYAENASVDFSAGSDARLRMQFELMQEDITARKLSVLNGSLGELTYSETDRIHELALDTINLPKEAFSLNIPLSILAEHDPTNAQQLFEQSLGGEGFLDVVNDALLLGFGANIGTNQNLSNILQDYGDQAAWLNVSLEALQDFIIEHNNDPNINEITGRIETIQQLLNLAEGAFDNLAEWVEQVPVTLLDLPPWLQDALEPIFGTPGVGPRVVFYGQFSPLVLDLDGNGIDLTNMNGSNAYFDFWGDGYAEKTGWVAPNDGLLTLDVNGNGSIDDVSELFGSGYPLEYFSYNNTIDIAEENGFAKLAVHDYNDDGVINAQDIVWNDLRVWQDLDQDGVSDDGELVTLDTLGIESIDIEHYQLSEYGNNGGAQAATYNRIIEDNVITHTSAYTKTDGTQHEIVDAWFQLEQQQSYYKPDYTLDVRTLFLPTLRGYGQISDLHIAMSIDNGTDGLLEQVQAFATGRDFSSLFNDFGAVRSEIEDILYAWVGIDAQSIRDNPSYADRGLFEQMPEYHFIRKFMGQDSDFIGTWFDQSAYLPRVNSAVKAITEGWDNIVDAFSARLIFQTGGSELFETGVSYNPFSDVFEGTIELTQAQINALEVEAAAHADTEGFWHHLAIFVDQIKGLTNLTTDEVNWITSAVSTSSGNALTWSDILSSFEDFDVNGTDGDDILSGTRWNDVINGGRGHDTLIGGDGNDILQAGDNPNSEGTNDILDGGLGNDILYGRYGDDIYRYDYGHDVIAGTHNGAFLDHDIIEFGAGINPGDVTFHYSDKNAAQSYARHAVFEVAGRGSISVELAGYGSRDYELIDELHFADGTIIQTADMLIHMHGSDNYSDSVTASNWVPNANVMLYGYGGNDSLYANSSLISFANGGEGNDTFWGSTGDDTLYLSSGNDQFYGGGGNNKILLPDGYDLSDVSFYRWNDPNQTYPSDTYRRDALIEIDGLGSVSIVRQFDGEEDDLVQTLEFSDGSSVDLLSQRYITLGSADNDDFNHSGGVWPNQSDTYLFSEGQDIIREYSGDHDTLLFGAGYQFSDLTIYREDIAAPYSTSNHLIIEDHLGNSTKVFLHFDTSYNNGGYVLEHLEFDDGTIIDLDSINYETRGDETDNAIEGIRNSNGDYDYDDVIYAYAGADNVYARSGNDIVYGGSGNDDIIGENGEDQLFGEDGDDELSGNNDNDQLYGGAGEDDLDGGAGNDLLIGGAGSDIVDAGDDNDTLVYNLSDNIAYFDAYEGGRGIDTLQVNLTNAEYSLPLYNDLQNFISYAAANYNTSSNHGTPYIFDYTGLSVSDVENLEVYVDGILTNSAPSTVAQLPTAQDDAFYAEINQIRTGNLFDDNGNGRDYDFNGDIITAFAETKSTAHGGSVTINTDGSFSYTPLTGYTGLDSFEYTLLTAINGESVTGQASLNVVDIPVLDVIEGTVAYERLNGTSASNILIAKPGDDEVRGAEGDDVYIYNLGDGNDLLFDNAGSDTLKFDDGISLSDIRFWIQGRDLELHLHGAKIVIEDQFHPTWTTQIEQATFADGSSVDLLNNLNFTGTDSDENLDGLTDSNETLIGGKGDDSISGKTGDDIYVYNMGDGNDFFEDVGGADKIVFGADVLPSDVRLVRGGHDLLLYVGDGFITIEYQFRSGWNQEIETAEFADGTIWDLLNDFTFTGSDEGEYVEGLADKSDILIGGFGDDQLRGNTGNDTYIYNLGDGEDVITDYGGIDKIVFGSGITIDDIRLFRSQNDLLIRIGYETIEIDNQYSTYGYEIETAEFADGSSISLVDSVKFEGSYASEAVRAIDSSDDLLFGYLGDDSLQGLGGNDQLIGGLGNDLLDGGQGNDSYVYNIGDGDDHIVDYGGVDKIVFGTGISVNDLRFSNVSGDLNITIGTEYIELDNQFKGYGHEIEIAEFSDGSTISLTENLTFTGTSSGESIFALHDSDDTIVGLEGNDNLYGLSGTDTAVYHGAYSNYTITDNASSLTVTDNVGSDGTDTLYEIEQLNFSDGSYDIASQTFTPLPSGPNIITGTVGNDNPLNGTTGDDQIDGLAGHDHIFGLDGDDIINGGDGNDTINGGLGDDILDGGSGYDTLSYRSATSGIAIDLGMTSAQDTGGAGIDTVTGFRAVDGSDHNDSIKGDNTANTLRGYDGNDVLEGLRGSDTIYGGNGIDTAVFSGYYAQYTVIDHGTHLTVEDRYGTDYTDTLYDVELLQFIDGTFSPGDPLPSTPIFGYATNDTLTGSSLDDLIYGLNGTDTIYGGAGNDTIDGGNQKDFIFGEDGDDILYGFHGTDVIDGGAGNDYMHGQTGFDTVSYQSALSGVHVDLGITSPQDTIGAGIDTILSFKGLIGSDYDDVLNGDNGTNDIDGGAGDDVINPGKANDTLTGGSGADRFVIDDIAALWGNNRITDFSTSDGDILDVGQALIGYDPLQDAINDFVTVSDNGTDTVIEVDRDGTGTQHNSKIVATFEGVTGLGDAATLETSGTLVTDDFWGV